MEELKSRDYLVDISASVKGELSIRMTTADLENLCDMAHNANAEIGLASWKRISAELDDALGRIRGDHR